MNVNADYTKAQEAAEMARAKAEAAKAAAEKELKEAEEANKAVDEANSKVAEQQNIYTQANSKVIAKQAELDSAIAALNALSGSEDEAAIANAEQTVERIKKELEEIQKEVQKEYEELLKAQQDVQTAIARAEIEQQEAEEAQKALEEAETELETAETELKEAEEAAKAEEVNTPVESGQLTEQQALEQGYTIIKTAAELQAINQNLSGKFILMNDIDLSGIDWEPIGKYNPTDEDPWGGAFKGVFNGNGYSITNLTVKAEDGATGVGLFGATEDAEISNLVLKDINVSASGDYNETAVGGLIGISRDTNIDNITVTGSVSGHQGVGGLIGRIEDSDNLKKINITNVTTDVNVNAAFYAGGLIGKVGGTEFNSLVIENCHTSGNISITDQAAGGLIGEAGKTVITVNKCSSSMDITKAGEEDTGLSWLLDDTSRIGGIIGNCNGTYISICNSEYTGTLTCDDEFKGENYGWYMNDAQVSIFELTAGLPADDILNIEGVEDITPVIDPGTGAAHYEITVSTLAGMNRIVDMIENNPNLAEVITFNIMFDFEKMDEAYDSNAEYKQYGVVQHLYEDTEGNIVNDVYIDNEIDCESTFNVGFKKIDMEPEQKDAPIETMVKGLYKGSDGKYYVCTPGNTVGKYEDFTEVTLQFFFENQHTFVNKRLDSDEVALRKEMKDLVYEYQIKIHDILKERYGWDPDEPVPVIQEPEYKALKKKQMSGATLSPEEELKIVVFELNYTICNIVSKITKNEGCGMGGNASFLDKNGGIVLQDAWGRERWMSVDGTELRQRVDENGELMFDEDGKPMFETLEGELYNGKPDEVFKVRGFAVTDENGNFLYTDSEGKTVVQKKAEDGTVTYTYEDGTPYEGNPEELTQQLEKQSPNEEQSPSEMLNELDSQMNALLGLYENGGAVDISIVNNNKTTPEEPTKPDVPVTPTEPDEPTTPDEPVTPEEPDVPVTPNVPTEPEEPTKPGEPINPDTPISPVTPEEPTEPTEPTEPEKPEATGGASIEGVYFDDWDF